MLEELSIQYDYLLNFASVNVDDNKVIAATHGVRNLPTLILFVNGKEVRRFIGLQNKEQLIIQLEKQLANDKINND